MIRFVSCFLLATGAFGQLTPEQKLFDFNSVTAVFAKRYAPLEWKQQLYNVNASDLAPWMDRVRGTATDLDFYELLVEYVSNFRDGHDYYALPSNFVAQLGISADIYDGRVLIESINRTALPLARYPFTAGDEILAIDGVAIGDLLQTFSKYGRYGNDRSTRRAAVIRLLTRNQSRIPHAVDVPDAANLQIQRASGAIESYIIPWLKSGVPLVNIDPVPMPQARFWALNQPVGTDPLAELSHSADPEPLGLLGYGSLSPIFALPSTFVRRLGVSTDFFYSGVFTSGGNRIGYIRLPSYDPFDTTAALAKFADEIAYMQANTDGLVVDEMRNTGGLLCYGESILTYLIPKDFTAMGYEIRVTREYLQSFANRVDSAKIAGDPALSAQYQTLYDAVAAAYAGNRGRSAPVPVCSPTFSRTPVKDKNGVVLAYSKPLIMLIDEFSVSTADAVAALFQDSGRGPLVGWRTNGMGGSNSLNTSRWQVGAYSEGDTGMTLSLMFRPNEITVDGYPATHYVENVGVQPDVPVDYMTRSNLMNSGRDFVEAFTAAINAQIAKAAQK